MEEQPIESENVEVVETTGGDDRGKRLQAVYSMLDSDEAYRPYVPATYDEFLGKIAKDRNYAQAIHKMVASDEVYSQYLPETFEETVSYFGLGKPSPTPQSGSGLGSTQSGGQMPMGQQPRSGASPSSAPAYLSPEELGAEAQMPTEEVIQTQTVQTEAPTPQELEPFKDPKVQDALRLEYLKKKAQKSKTESEAYKGSLLGGLYNSAIEGLGSTLQGGAYMLGVMFGGDSEQFGDETEDERIEAFTKKIEEVGIKKTIDELKSKGTTQEFIDKAKEEGGIIAQGVFGLAESAPAMLTPMQVGFLFSTFETAHKEMRKEMPDASPAAQFLYAATQGTVAMLLEKAGVSNLIQNKSVMKNLTGKIVNEIQQMGVKMTPEVVESTAAKLVNGFLAEAETGGLQYVSEESIKQIADALEGEKDVFKFEGWQQFLSNTVDAAASEGVGGFVMKGLGEATSAIKSPADKQKASQDKQQVDEMMNDLSNPNVSPEAKQAISKKVDEKAEAILETYASEQNKIQGLSEEGKKEFTFLSDQATSMEAVLADPNVSDATKQAVQADLEETNKKIETILSSAKETEQNILLSGLREGWVSESYYAFDPREFRDLMPLINGQRSFAKVVEKNGKKYAVVGLSLAPESRRYARTSGRDNFSFAAVELNENTPSNIVETLEKSARENFKNIYRDFSDKDSVSPIKEKDAELSSLEQETKAEQQPTETAQPKVTVEEIKSLPLTRIEGAGMGSNQAVGTFISTEPENRYAKQFPDAEVQSMEVEIENPFVSEDTNLIDFRNELANRRKSELDETDFTEAEIPDGNFTVDDLSDSGIEKVAGMVTEELKAQGYDSIYFPKTETQEGELVVFDRGKARKKGEAATTTEQAPTTETQTQSQQAPTQANPLADVESTAKALEGKDISTKINTTLKEINHFSDNKTFEFDKNRGAWFTTDKSGYVRRPGAKTKITRYIDESVLNLATEKQVFQAGDGDFEKGLKELENQGYDGVKTKNNNSTEYYIFDVNKTKNRQELISEAYHADKSAGKETELTKAVEELLTPQQDATQSGNQQQNDQQQREGTAGSQQGQQADRTNQEADVATSQAETSGGDSVAEGGKKKEVAIEDIDDTAVDKTDQTIIAYHATPTGKVSTGKEAGIHIGTKKAAEQVKAGRNQGKGTVEKVKTTIKRPLVLSDMPSWSSANLLSQLYNPATGQYFGLTRDKVREVRDSDMTEKQKQQWILDFLKEKGYDAIAYKNDSEDAGSYSYVLFEEPTIESGGTTSEDIEQAQASTQQEVTPEQQQRINTRSLLSEISDWNKLGSKAKRSPEGVTEMQRLQKAGKELGLTVDTKAIKSGLRLVATNGDGQVMTVEKVNKVMNPKRVVWSDANYAVQETTDANGNRVIEFYDAKTGDQIRSNSKEGAKAKEAYYEGNIQKFLGKDKPIDIDALLDYYGMDSQRFNNAVLEAVAESDNAFEIAANYQLFVNHDAELVDTKYDPTYELAQFVGRMSERDFNKYFDKNFLNKNSKWIDPNYKGEALDKRISGWIDLGNERGENDFAASLRGKDSSEILDDLTNLVQGYPDGPDSVRQAKEGELLPLASQRFREITGKPLNVATAYEFNEMFNRYADNQAFGFASKVAWEDLSPQQKQEIIDEQTRPVEDEFFFEGTDFENQPELFAENEQDQGGAEEAKVKPQPIKETGNKAADAVRKLKISRPDYLTSSLGTAVWDAAVETVASAIEGGASVAQAIQNAVTAIKESEYYKSITDGQKRKFLSDFIGSVNSSITPEMAPDYSPILSVGEISKSSLKERMLNGNASKAVKQMIADNGIEFETQNQELARQYANDVIREIGIDAAVDLAQRGVIKGAPKTFILGANVDAKVSAKGDGSLEAMEAINIFDEALRSAGREIAAAYRVYLNSPEGLYAFEKQKVVRNIDKKLSKGQKNVDIKKTKTAVSKEGKSTAKDVAKDVVDGLAGKPPRPKSETSAPKVENEKQKAAQKKKVNALAKLKASSGLTSGGFSKEFFEGLAELGAANIELGYYKVEAWLKQMKKDLKSAGIDNVSDDDILSVLDQPLPDGTSMASMMEAAKWEAAAEQLAAKINSIFKKPSTMYNPVQSIINGLYQKVAEKVNVEKKKPLSDIDKAKALIENYEEAKQVWERAKELEIEKIESMDISEQDKAALIFDIDFFFEETIGFPLSETAADKLITNELKDRIKSGESITDAIEKILADAFVYGTNSKDAMIKSISDKLQLNVNLSAADANAIAKKFADRYDKKMSDYAQNFLDKQFKPKPLEDEKKRKQQHSAIARQVIWGALDDAKFRAAFYDKYGFDFLADPKFDQALKDLTKEVYKAPEGFLRDEAQANLNAFVRIAEKGFNYWSIPNSLIVDNLLAGTETMIKALDSNTINTIAIAGQMIAKDPKNAKFILEKLFTAKGKKDMLSISLRRMGGWMGLKGMKQRDEADNADISKLLAENHPNKYMRGLGYWMQKSGRALTAIDYATSMPAKYTKFADLMLADVKARGNKLSDGTKVSQRQAEAIVNEILGETTDALQSAMDQAEIDIATMFPKDKINTTAKIPNKATIAYKNRVFEILEQKRMERANDIKSKVDWMADFTEDELAVYEKYASKYADKVSLMGTPNGSLGMVALGMKGVGQQAPILRFLQAAPWFINAPLNLTNMLYDSIPLVGLSRAASFMIKGRRGLLVSDKAAEQLGLFRREDNERLYKEQRNSLLKRVAALQVASITGLMLAGFFDDDEEKDKYKTITDYIKSKGIYMTGSLSVNPEKASAIEKATGLKPYTLYIDGKEAMSYRNNALLSVFGLTGNVLDSRNFGNKEDEELLSSYVNGVGSTIAFINETSALRGFSDAIAAYFSIGKYEGATGSSVDRVMKSLAKSSASSLQATILPRVIPSTYKDIQGALLYDKKKATNFLEFMVNDVPFLEDMIVTKQYDHFGEPLKEEFFVPSPLGGLSLIGWENGTFSGPFQEIQSQSKYYRMAQEAGYKPTAYKETKYEVEVSPLEYLALNPSDKIKGLKADRADQGLDGEPKKNEKGMYAFQLNITPEKLAEINQVRGQFVRNWLDKNEAIFLQKTKAERNNILKNLYTTGTTLAKGKVLNLDNEVYRFVPVEVGANGFEVSGAFIPTKLY